MTPEHIATLTNLLRLVQMISGWPLYISVALIIVGPWIIMLTISGGYQRRFEAVVKMYESNVQLVKSYEDLSKDFKDMIVLNTQTIAKLDKAIEDNQFCPMVRLDKKAKGIINE